MISGKYFVISFVQAIRPGDNVTSVEDGSMIPILYNGLWSQQQPQQKNISTSHEHDTDNKTPSPMIRVPTTIAFPAQRQILIPIHEKLQGLVDKQPEP